MSKTLFCFNYMHIHEKHTRNLTGGNSVSDSESASKE